MPDAGRRSLKVDPDRDPCSRQRPGLGVIRHPAVRPHQTASGRALLRREVARQVATVFVAFAHAHTPVGKGARIVVRQPRLSVRVEVLQRPARAGVAITVKGKELRMGLLWARMRHCNVQQQHVLERPALESPRPTETIPDFSAVLLQ